MKNSFSAGQWIAKHENNGISTQEHLGNVSVFIDGLGLFLALSGLGNFGPQLFDVLQHHVAMPIESLYTRQQLLVVSAIDENLLEGKSRR